MSRSSSRGDASAMSPSTSAKIPPRPKATTGPKEGSRFMPTMNSRLPVDHPLDEHGLERIAGARASAR